MDPRKKEEKYIYYKGVRLINSKYFTTYDNNSDSSDGELLVDEIMKKVDEATLASVNAPWRGGKYDEYIKMIMLQKLYLPASQSIDVLCPICDKMVSAQSQHFEMHVFIFARGCVYCNCDLTLGDYEQYCQHIEQNHQNEVQKNKE